MFRKIENETLSMFLVNKVCSRCSALSASYDLDKHFFLNGRNAENIRKSKWKKLCIHMKSLQLKIRQKNSADL